MCHIIKKEKFIYFVIYKQNTLPLFHCYEIKWGRREKKREMDITNSPSHTDEQVYKKEQCLTTDERHSVAQHSATYWPPPDTMK